MDHKTPISSDLKKLLKSIATASSECITKYENKASYKTDHPVPNLIDFTDDNWKEIRTKIEKWNISICKKYFTD